jgi:hypothetical protein
MEQVASAIEPFGFTAEAGQLRVKASELRARRATPGAPPIVPVVYDVPAVIPSPPVPTPVYVAPPAARTASVSAPNGLRLRSQPNEGSSELGLLPLGTTVTVLQEGLPPTNAAPRGWTKVRTSAGQEGFVSSEWLQAGDPSTPYVQPAVPTTASIRTATVTAPSGLRIRSQPNESSSIVSEEAWFGTKVQIVQEGFPPTAAAPSGWTKVRAPSGKEGYASAQWLQLDAPVPAISGSRIAIGNRGSYRCAAPGGCRLRDRPAGRTLAFVRKGDTVDVQRRLSGGRADARSPGAEGGWAEVVYERKLGWLPSEWLV